MFIQIVQVAQVFVAYSMLVLVFSVGSLLKSFPSFRKSIIRAFDMITKVKLPVTSYWDSLFSDQMFQNVWHSVALDMNKKAKQGGDAPNSPVVTSSGKICFPLLEVANAGRPLVLNFGSCTCPIFMSQLNDFQEMVDQFKDIADFCVVYIEEAHPADGWALKVRWLFRFLADYLIWSGNGHPLFIVLVTHILPQSKNFLTKTFWPKPQSLRWWMKKKSDRDLSLHRCKTLARD